MPIPSYDDWMNQTKLGSMSVRSSSLKNVDAALAEYWKDKSNKKTHDVRQALQTWIRETGSGWRSSERNRPPRRIITELYDALNETPVFRPEEIAALEFQEEERRKRLKLIFQNKKVVWRSASAPEEAKLANQQLQETIRNSGYASSGLRQVPDAQAIKDVRAAQQKQIQERQTYQAGPWTQGRDAFNAGAEIGLGVASVVAKGIGRKAIEEGFGTAGAQAGGEAFGEMCRGLFGGGASMGEINSHLIQTTGMGTREMFTSFVPLLSNVTSGAKLLIAWGKAGLACYRQYSANDHGAYLSQASDMRAAFGALQTVLDREFSARTREAAIQTVDFAARTASSFVDFGISGNLTGLVTSTSKLVNKIYLLGREYHETKKANQALVNPNNLSTRIFTTYPLLGCYMIVCSDMSELISMVRFPDQSFRANQVRFGAAGWMDDVEQIAAEHINPLRETAARAIRVSPFVIDKMPIHAISQPNFLTKLGQRVSKAEVGLNIAKGVLRTV